MPPVLVASLHAFTDLRDSKGQSSPPTHLLFHHVLYDLAQPAQ